MFQRKVLNEAANAPTNRRIEEVENCEVHTSDVQTIDVAENGNENNDDNELVLDEMETSDVQMAEAENGNNELEQQMEMEVVEKAARAKVKWYPVRTFIKGQEYLDYVKKEGFSVKKNFEEEEKY